MKITLTPEQLKAFPTSCEACGSLENLHIDHCHTTGVVRGILCSKCNIALGLLKDKGKNIQGLLEYLENSQ